MDDKLFHTIGEVSKMLGVNASLLRFWETQFEMLKPHKNKKGNRYYTPQDIILLKEVFYLTKECGYTLEGAKEKMRKSKIDNSRMETVRTLQSIKDFLLTLKDTL